MKNESLCICEDIRRSDIEKIKVEGKLRFS